MSTTADRHLREQLRAALGWPGGISGPAMSWEALLQTAALMRVRVAELEAVHEDASGAILQAVEAERERCARLCEDEARLWEDDRNGRPATEARLCAARIRGG